MSKPTQSQPPDLSLVVESWSSEADSRVEHVRNFPAREARYADPSAPMHPRLQGRLSALGLDRLYAHQAQAFDHVQAGEDVVVVTGTNSGKTLCYNLPAVQKCLSEPMARALYLFPTKALAQDQLGKLEDLLAGLDLRAATYDGDTPQARRASIRKAANIVLTNPDMLHVGILPGHEHWAKFFRSVRLIVLDEIHVYRGVFGSHVAGIVRRLLRLCEWHRSQPRIVACSATIGNPVELFEDLTGREPRMIADDGAPRSKRTFVFWNPPLVGDQRASANLETAKTLVRLGTAGLRTLAFSRARVSAELVLKYARQLAESSDGIEPARLESYRAGYTAKERREIERSLFKGDLLGLSSTNAMELGVDVGGLDAVVMNGYPGTVSSFWQQAGRAGRGTREGLAVLVGHDDPLEQFMIREPELLLAADTERVAINPSNPTILAQQIRCAAYERPIAPTELPAFGETALQRAEELDRSGELRFSGGLFYHPSHEPPAPQVNIRGLGGDPVTLMVEGQALGTMEWSRALQSAHAGAVYLHRGVSYLVRSFDTDTRVADLEQANVDYYTQPVLQSVIDCGPELDARRSSSAHAALTALTVTDLVLGYRIRALENGLIRDTIDLEMPSNTYDTVGIRFQWPEGYPAEIEMPSLVGGVHGAEHALMAVAPIVAGCDRGDLGNAWYASFFGSNGLHPTVFAFDRTPGGVGLCEALFGGFERWIAASIQILASCPCRDGCPACLLSSRCESNNEPLDKARARELLLRLR